MHSCITSPPDMLFRELLDALLLTHLTDQQGIILLCDNIPIKSLHHNTTFLSGMYEAILCLKKADIRTDADIVVIIVLALSMKASPCTQVTPTKRCRENKNLLSLL